MMLGEGPELPRICSSCTFCEARTEHGADWQTCGHRVDGAPGPMAPHVQRTQAADVGANVCGVDGIFWKAKQ